MEGALLTADDLPDGLIDLGLRHSGGEICGMRTERPRSVQGDEFPTVAGVRPR